MDKITFYSGKQRKNSEGEGILYLWPLFNTFLTTFNSIWIYILGIWIWLVWFGFLLVSGPVESDPEYRLIVAANNLTVEIDNELSELGVPAWLNNSKCNEFNVFLLNITLSFSLGFRYHLQVHSGQVLQEVPRARVSGARFSRLHPNSQGEMSWHYYYFKMKVRCPRVAFAALQIMCIFNWTEDYFLLMNVWLQICSRPIINFERVIRLSWKY